MFFTKFLFFENRLLLDACNTAGFSRPKCKSDRRSPSSLDLAYLQPEKAEQRFASVSPQGMEGLGRFV